jgi:PKD repeat protein
MVFGIETNGVLEPSFNEPFIKTVDFNNGTKEMIIDYYNGTRNCVTETFIEKTATPLSHSNEIKQGDTTVSSEPVTFKTKRANMVSLAPLDTTVKYANTTQTAVLQQQMMMGFTYTLAYWQQQWSKEIDWWVFRWYFAVGIDIDIQFGLRLPISITLEYPEQMIAGNNYIIHVTLDPIDMPNFDELLLTFKANIWAQASGFGIDVPRTVLFGPDIDGSKTFVTPLGSDVASLFHELKFNVFEIIKKMLSISLELKEAMDLISKFVVPYLVVQLTFGSNQITAKANTFGDARVVEGADLNWLEPNQTVNFLVNADEYDSATNYSRLILSDFKYYFTKFEADFDLEFDLNEIINRFGIEDPPPFRLYTLDLSKITGIFGAPYLASYPGYPGSIYATIYVQRVGISDPQPPLPEDVVISYAYAAQHRVFAGEILNITVGTKNLGSMSETFNVTVYADSSAIDVKLVQGLTPGEERSLTFVWNTTGFSPSHIYNITAKASEIPNEIDLYNNVLSAGIIEIVLQPPIANFTYSPMPPIVNQTTTFNASNSIPGHGTLVSYIWDFGDGNNLTTANPVVRHVFANYGNYTITLTVIDSEGLNDTVWEFIDVNPEAGHDVAIMDIVLYQGWAYQGQTLNITVIITNKGNHTETVEVRLYHNISAGEAIDIKTTNLKPGENETLTYTWNTSHAPYCHNYTLMAIAGISFDSKPADNIRLSHVKVRIPGDINEDGTVDIVDISRAARAFGTYPRHPRWDPDADQNGDGKINIVDLTLIALHWKTKCP